MTERVRIKSLRDLRNIHGRGVCWICGSQSGIKKGRNAYKVRCTRCEKLNRTSVDIAAYEALSA